MSNEKHDKTNTEKTGLVSEIETTQTIQRKEILTAEDISNPNPNQDLGQSVHAVLSQDLIDELVREIGDRYRLLEPIGEGGMAIIYKAEQVQLGREVAIKLMKSPDNLDDVQRFETEAAIAAKLEHPNIVRVYDFGRLSNGHMYIVMEYVSGETLKSYVLNKGPMGAATGVSLLRQISEALVEIHQNHVVHRDIKPSNIILIRKSTGQLMAKLIDFGIVKDLHAGSEESLGGQGIIGSPMYMSPEQISGGIIDHRSDLYALGLTFYFAFTGQNPYHTEDILTLLKAQQTQRLPSISEFSVPAAEFQALVWLIERLTEKVPANRIQLTSKVVEVLTAVEQRISGGSTIGITQSAEKKYSLSSELDSESEDEEENSDAFERPASEAPHIESVPSVSEQQSSRRLSRGSLLRIIGVLLGGMLLIMGWMLQTQRTLVKALLNPESHAVSTSVTLTTMPSGASVYAEGVLLGTTPFTIHLSDDEHKSISVKLDGYQDLALQLSPQVPNPNIRLNPIQSD